jgi:succinate-semialdehyde dehydrogenase/glutarate-semialdehyde dehydrogenase
MESRNPATDELIRTWSEATEDEVASALERASSAQSDWARASFAERGQILRRAAELLRESKTDLAQLMADEMGKPLPQGVAEVEKCAWACEYYAARAEAFLADEPVALEEGWKAAVVFRPLGCVLAVMPWNFPFWQVYRFAAPALMAGNVAILKHASNVSGCAVRIAEIFADAGLPDGVFQTLLIGSSRVPDLIADPIVRAVTLTGSTPAGAAVASEAGTRLKKTVLELGGSDPYVVLHDCDFDRTVETCVSARLINSGQSCIAAKRFIVEAPIYDRFVDAMTAAMSTKRWGPPADPDVALGPLARRDLRDEIHRQVQRSIGQGARLTTGGEIPDGPGAYYPPTVLADVAPGMAAFDEETFGPVAAIVRARDAEEAIALANETPFGLGAAVFTQDTDRGWALAADALDAGSCFVNAFVRSDPRLPFGGIKESGYGRELSSFGIREFVNIKTVCAALG